MNFFDAKINIAKAHSCDVQYFVIVCYPNIPKEQLLNIKTFLIRYSLQIIFKSTSNHFWIAALKTEDGNKLKKLRGIKMIGGVNIDSEKLLKATQPVIITQYVN
jgi:hypothetical protein